MSIIDEVIRTIITLCSTANRLAIFGSRNVVFFFFLYSSPFVLFDVPGVCGGLEGAEGHRWPPSFARGMRFLRSFATHRAQSALEPGDPKVLPQRFLLSARGKGKWSGERGGGGGWELGFRFELGRLQMRANASWRRQKKENRRRKECKWEVKKWFMRRADPSCCVSFFSVLTDWYLSAYTVRTAIVTSSCVVDSVDCRGSTGLWKTT